MTYVVTCDLCVLSHDLQTCDWPRNVGCSESGGQPQGVSTVRVTDSRTSSGSAGGSAWRGGSSTPGTPSTRQMQSQRGQQQQQQQQQQVYTLP